MADLVATKENQNIVVEVKAGKLTPDRKKKLAELADYVNELGNYQFKVAIAKLPQDKELKIDNLEQIFFDYFSENTPNEITKLATHTIKEIPNIFLNKLVVSNNALIAEGSGIIRTKVQSLADENIPFDFKVQLSFRDKGNIQIDKFIILDIDTSLSD